MNLQKHNLLLLLAIIAIGAALRIASLFNQLPDGDELWTLHMVQLPWLEVIRYSILQDFNPPFFYLAAKALASVGGATITMVRMPSLVAGILLIPVAYLIGKEVQDELLGLLTAGFIAILYPVVYYSQYARSFAMAGLFTAIAIYVFVRMTQWKSGEWLFILAGLAAVYTHAFTVVPLLLMAAYLLMNGQLMVRNAILGALAAVPFVVMMGTIALSRHQNFGISPGWVATYIPWELFGYIAPIVVVLIIAAWLPENRDKLTVIFTVVPIVTATFAVLISFWTPVFPRYTLAAMPMLAVVAMQPVARWIRGKKYQWLLPVGALIIVLNLVQIVALWFLQLHPAGAP